MLRDWFGLQQNGMKMKAEPSVKSFPKKETLCMYMNLHRIVLHSSQRLKGRFWKSLSIYEIDIISSDVFLRALIRYIDFSSAILISMNSTSSASFGVVHILPCCFYFTNLLITSVPSLYCSSYFNFWKVNQPQKNIL